MTIFSFRAECPHDVNAFKEALRVKDPRAMVTEKNRSSHGEPYVEMTSALSFEALLEIIRDQEDAHVMLQTLAPVPLADNPLKRDYDRR